MIQLTNQTITLPMLQICSGHTFMAGFVWGGICTIILCFMFKFITVVIPRE